MRPRVRAILSGGFGVEPFGMAEVAEAKGVLITEDRADQFHVHALNAVVRAAFTARQTTALLSILLHVQNPRHIRERARGTMSNPVPPKDAVRSLSYLDGTAGQLSWDELRRQAAPGRRRRRILWLAVLVLVIGGIVVAVVAIGKNTPNTGPTQYRLTTPHAIGDYTRIGTNADLKAELHALLGGAPAPLKRLLADAAIGTYSQARTSRRLDIFAFPTPDAQSLKADLPVDLLPNLPKALTYPPGPRGGQLTCGTDRNAIVLTTECAWRDAATTGYIVSRSPALPQPRAARLTNTIRDALEN